MKYKVSHTTKYSYTESVPVCQNQIHLAPRDTAVQRCEQFRLLVSPMPAVRSQRTDYFGNRVDYFSIQEAHYGLTVTSTSKLNVLDRVEPDGANSTAWDIIAAELPIHRDQQGLQVQQYTYDSKHVQRDPQCGDYARQSFPPGRPILEACRELTSRVFADFRYDPKATTISTPVDEVFASRAGVCQDFAHLQIACLRSMGLAARYVSGYLRTLAAPGKPRLVGADASHAWLSVYCGSLGWIDFDPTNNVIPTSDHLTIAWGRDYEDVCPIKGVFVGGGEHRMSVSVDVEPLDM